MAAAVDAWGQRKLDELEAEERLAFACEKAPSDDPVVQKLRATFLQVRCPGARRPLQAASDAMAGRRNLTHVLCG